MIYQSRKPADIYRRVELDARIEGSNGIGLTRLCLEDAIGELARAELAWSRGNRLACNEALTRASSAIAALHSGIAQDNPLRSALLHLYGSAESTVLSAITDYRPATLERVKQDLTDIRAILS